METILRVAVKSSNNKMRQVNMSKWHASLCCKMTSICQFRCPLVNPKHIHSNSSACPEESGGIVVLLSKLLKLLSNFLNTGIGEKKGNESMIRTGNLSCSNQIMQLVATNQPNYANLPGKMRREKLKIACLHVGNYTFT